MKLVHKNLEQIFLLALSLTPLMIPIVLLGKSGLMQGLGIIKGVAKSRGRDRCGLLKRKYQKEEL